MRSRTVTTRRSVLTVAIAALIAISVATQAPAQPITLTSGNSVVEIDPDTSDGVYSWTIMGVPHLAQQWFWIRTDIEELDDNGGLYYDREYSIDEISAPSVSQPTPNIAVLVYDDENITVEVTYILVSGPGLLAADLAETVKITNNMEEEIEIDFFQYSDFDLGGTEGDELVSIMGGSTAVQFDLVAGYAMSETIVGNNPELSEVGIYSDTLDKLEDDGIDDLDASTVLVGPDDLTWAFQWKERLLLPGEALVIGKDKLIEAIPEPGSALVLVAGLAGLASRRRRRK